MEPTFLAIAMTSSKNDVRMYDTRSSFPTGAALSLSCGGENEAPVDNGVLELDTRGMSDDPVEFAQLLGSGPSDYKNNPAFKELQLPNVTQRSAWRKPRSHSA